MINCFTVEERQVTAAVTAFPAGYKYQGWYSVRGSDTMRRPGRVSPALCLLSLAAIVSSKHKTLQYNDTKTSPGPARSPKVFSLFSIVQFPNSACTSTSSTYSNGTCLTTSECSSKGGSAQGNCAAGFGVCCICKFDWRARRLPAVNNPL